MNNRYNGHQGGFGGGHRPSLADELNELERVKDVMTLKTTYVDEAYRIFREQNPPITRTKLRSIYNMLLEAIADETDNHSDTLLTDTVMELKMFRVRMVYDAGRDKSVKQFLQASSLLGFLKSIDTDKEKLSVYCKYFEALVAYHRFMHPKDD